MIREFISFVEELFPSISPYTKEQVKQAIRQFNESGQQYKFCMHQPLEFLSQGDVIETLPFIRYDDQGNQMILKTKGILLSNTCDADNDDTIVFAPLLPIDKLGIDRSAITSNLIYRFLYIPDAPLLGYVVDFSLINSFSKTLIEKGLKQGRLAKLASLNQFGYYLFLCKLTVHLMRPEDERVQADRAS
jgi:hypothetical protein